MAATLDNPYQSPQSEDLQTSPIEVPRDWPNGVNPRVIFAAQIVVGAHLLAMLAYALFAAVSFFL